jgi:hypothetical protein
MTPIKKIKLVGDEGMIMADKNDIIYLTKGPYLQRFKIKEILSNHVKNDERAKKRASTKKEKRR